MGREDELFDKYMHIRQMTDMVRNKKISEAGLLGDTTRGRGRVFSLLKQKDGISTKELASKMGIRVSSLNEVLGKMEKEGFIERYPSEDDKRVMLIELTDKGRAVEMPDQDMPKVLFGSMDIGTQNQLALFFEKMISSLRYELKSEEERAEDAAAEAAAAKERIAREKAAKAAAAEEAARKAEEAKAAAAEEAARKAAEAEEAAKQPVAAQPIPQASPVQTMSSKPAAPAAPVQPAAAKPAAPVQATQPAAPAQPVQPVVPVKPAIPVQPSRSGQEQQGGSFKKFFSRFSSDQ